jgi:ATP-dependent RNA helicase DDX46/PRP5
MIDMLCANAGKVTNLKRVSYLTIDEADRMFDLGFEPQVPPITYYYKSTNTAVRRKRRAPKSFTSTKVQILFYLYKSTNTDAETADHQSA